MLAQAPGLTHAQTYNSRVGGGGTVIQGDYLELLVAKKDNVIFMLV